MAVLDLGLADATDAVDVEVHTEADHGDRNHERQQHRAHLEAEQGCRAVVAECRGSEARSHHHRRPVRAMDERHQQDDERNSEEDEGRRLLGGLAEHELRVDRHTDRVGELGSLAELRLHLAEPRLLCG